MLERNAEAVNCNLRGELRRASWLPVTMIMLICGLAPACDRRAEDAPVADIWARRCSTCHGADGSGNGAAAKRLDPRPRDLRDPLWQDARDDAEIGTAIVQGGQAIGRSSLMPPHLDLAGRREDLVRFVRGLRKPNALPRPTVR